MTFDPTINAGNVLVLIVAIVGLIGAWFKFGGRIDMLEYKVGAVETTLQAIGKTLEKIAETETKIALIDQRQLELERSQATTMSIVEGLRKGEGYITARRANLEGEYTK